MDPVIPPATVVENPAPAAVTPQMTEVTPSAVAPATPAAPVIAAPATPAPAPAPEAPAPAQTHEEKVGVLAMMKASLLGKAQLVETNHTQNTQLTTANAQIAALTNEVARLTAENAQLTDGLNEVNTLIQERSTTVAHEQLATVGQPMAALPQVMTLEDTETLQEESLDADKLWDLAGKETDPDKKAALIDRANKAEAAA